MKKFFRDALNAALQKLRFPWLTPHPTKTTKEVGYFQTTISDSDLYEMFKRNQLAHNIVFEVAYDALASGFKCVAPDGEEKEEKKKEEFDSKVQTLYRSFIHQSLLKAYVIARLYGSSGILFGYRDTDGFDKPIKIKSKDKIDYLFAIPHKWINQKVGVTDNSGAVTVPPKLSHYELSSPSTINIDASRIVHLQPPSAEEDFKGESCLHPIFDVLTVLKNADWAVGQAMFRHGAGLTTVVAGEGASQAQIDTIDEVVSEINSKTVLTFPPGCKIESHRPGALDPEKYYNVIVTQIAGGSNIPVSILVGAQKGALEASAKDRKDYADFLASIQSNVLTSVLTDIIKKFQLSGQLPDIDFKIVWTSPSIFLMDVARARLYEARAEHEHAKAQLLQLKLNHSSNQEGMKVDATSPS